DASLDVLAGTDHPREASRTRGTARPRDAAEGGASSGGREVARHDRGRKGGAADHEDVEIRLDGGGKSLRREEEGGRDGDVASARDLSTVVRGTARRIRRACVGADAGEAEARARIVQRAGRITALGAIDER